MSTGNQPTLMKLSTITNNAAICELPVETASHIAIYCEQRDFPSILLGCKKLNVLFSPAAYTTINVSDTAAASLLWTLTGSFESRTHSYPLFVRRLHLQLTIRYPKPRLTLTLMQALTLTTNLRHLALLVEPTRIPSVIRDGYKLGIIAPALQRRASKTLQVLHSLTVHETPQLFLLANKRSLEHVKLTHHLLPRTLAYAVHSMRYAWSKLQSIELCLHERTTLLNLFRAISIGCPKLQRLAVSRARSSSIVSYSSTFPSNTNRRQTQEALLLLVEFAPTFPDLRGFSLNSRCTISPLDFDEDADILDIHRAHLQELSELLPNATSVRFGTLLWNKQNQTWHPRTKDIICRTIYAYVKHNYLLMYVTVSSSLTSLIIFYFLFLEHKVTLMKPMSGICLKVWIGFNPLPLVSLRVQHVIRSIPSQFRLVRLPYKLLSI